MTTTFVRATQEYLKADVTDVDALTVEAAALGGAVEMSLDRETWITAAWDGEVFMKWIDDLAAERPTRKARIFLDHTTVEDLPKRQYDVFVRLADAPEISIVRAGTLRLI